MYVLLAVLVSGCALQNAYTIRGIKNDINSYVAEYKPKAIAGSIKWTEYYQGVIDRVKGFPDGTEGKGVLLIQWTEMYNVAKNYEDGKMTKDEFYQWRDSVNNRDLVAADKYKKLVAECQYESVKGSASVVATGRSGLNFDQAFKEQQIFDLCMQAKQ